ncbi:MAG TPA: hypothetical protein VM055_07925 [Novosphingobium sp.]|nr:hypothetical protein [Novosphingobium sp.]
MSWRAIWLAGGLIAASSAMVVAQDAPESLLPPGFDDPPPSPTPTPRPTSRPAVPAPGSTAVPVVQPLPGVAAPAAGPALGETLDPKLLEQLIEAQRPRYDIPPAAARSLAAVGVVAEAEGGLPEADTARLNGRYLRSVLEGTRRPLVSRWGSILLRRALASRLATPVGLDGATWAALRARVLLRMGEIDAARALVQEVDSSAYTLALEDAALDAYVATGDLLGVCPIVAITAGRRGGGEWQMVRQICRSFEGEGSGALAELERLRRRGVGGGFTNVDLLLAQKYAGAALESRKAVKIEWTEVEEMTPWRYGLSLATGLEPPAALMDRTGHRFDPWSARAPMLGLAARAEAADYAAARGILSSAAMIDLWSQLRGDDDVDAEWTGRAGRLREAYVAAAPADRLAAMRELWGDDSDPIRAHSRRVLTAYAAARMPVSEDFADASGDLVASMLTAGLDRNAARWLQVVEEGSAAWALLAVGVPGNGQIDPDGVDTFHDDDPSEGARKSRFLLAGLYGLGRIERAAAGELAGQLGVNLTRETRWTRAIDDAARSGNQPLVAFLAGLGMQGEGWDQMTALHLYHVVSSLRRVGLEPEARMIAAEAVAQG